MQSSSPRLDILRARIRKVCDRVRGRKKELADYLEVKPHMVSEWLGDKNPGGEYTLAMVEWVTEKEAEDSV